MGYLVVSWVVWLYGCMVVRLYGCKVVGSLGQKTKNTTTGGPLLYYGRTVALLREG